MSTPNLNIAERSAQKPLVRLITLEPGEQFVMPSMMDIYRNLTVLRTGDCSICVSGQKRDSASGPWQQFSDRFSINTPVVPTGEKVEISENANGSMEIKSTQSINLAAKSDSNNSNRENSDNPIAFLSLSPKSTLRTKLEVEFPKDRMFTIGGIAEEQKLDYATVMNSFNRQRGNFEVKETRPPTGRGKPTNVWGFKNN